MIRVFVVDDSATVRARLVEILATQDDIAIVGQARNGREAIEGIIAVRPDVITLDLALPEVDGLGVTEHIMAVAPTPILIVSSSFNRGEVFNTLDALTAGAVDVLDKSPDSDPDWDAKFIASVRMVARIKVITHPRGRLRALERNPPTSPPSLPLSGPRAPAVPGARADLVAIGASTGGPGALVDVLNAMPRPFPLPIVIVLHVDSAFATSFTEWLSGRTHRNVRLAMEGEPLASAGNQVLFAPPGKHLTIVNGRVRLVDGPPRHHCRPSVDVLFDSLSLATGTRVAAALLTGMGRDGAQGLLSIRRAGGHTIAQDEATSIVYGMPREAALIGAADRILPLNEIGAALTAASLGGDS